MTLTVVSDCLVKVDNANVAVSFEDVSFGKVSVDETLFVDLSEFLKDAEAKVYG